jgi:hypothetical protein
MATSSAREGAPQPLSSRRRIRSLMSNEELTRDTIKSMMGNLEWAGPVFQAVALLVSGIYDPFIGHANVFVLTLAAAHLLFIPFYYRGYGPFARGGWWLIASPLQGIAVNALLAVLSQPETYGNNITCVPGCNYSATTWLFLAHYPWLPPQLMRWRALFEAPLLGLYYCYFLLLAWLNNGHLSWMNVKSAGVSFLWLLIAYLFGKAIGKMCLVAAERQLKVQTQNYQEFFDFLHSNVKSGIAAARIDLHDPLRVEEKLSELEETVGSYRVELLLAQEQVPLAALFSEHIRTFSGVLEMAETPRVGQLTLVRPIGVLVGRALGDLLTNAAKYGATAVQIRCNLTRKKAELEIADNGPGFPATILDDESRSLHRLRRAARDLGGDLTMRPQYAGTGAVLTLSAPLHIKRGGL